MVSARARKIDYIRSFLEGDLSLTEILESEGRDLDDFEILWSFGANIFVQCIPVGEDYLFTIDAYHYVPHISSDELDDEISLMRGHGFEDYGVAGGYVEMEELECAECKWKTSSDVAGFEDWDKLVESMKCPKCDSWLHLTRHYDHAHLEGTKTIELNAREIERLIEESKSITEFAEKLLERLLN